MSEKHIADAETKFMAVNITPDFCKVGGAVVPFDIFRRLPPERAAYAATVKARGEKVLMVGSITSGVVGNMGSGIASGVSQGAGDVAMIQGSRTVHAEGRLVSRHRDLCHMNVKS